MRLQRSGLALALVAAVTVLPGSVGSGLNSLTSKLAGSLTGSKATDAKGQMSQKLAKMPLYFIENQGQLDPKISHFLQGATTSVYFNSGGLTYSLKSKSTGGGQPPGRYSLNVDFVGANKVTPTALNKTEATINYFKGSADRWKTGIPTSSRLEYRNLWPGIDLVYSGTGEKLKYDFHVAPGADPSRIKLAYRGASSLKVNSKGRLEVESTDGVLTDERPVAYQQVDGKRKGVESSYALSRPANDHSYGFRLGDYDRTKPLIIDPAVLVYSGFIGGAENDRAEAIAVDSSGAAYITGFTNSLETASEPSSPFPASGGPDLTNNGGANDAFVAKVNPAGTGLVYAGYIGGSGDDRAFGIGVDASGAAYVAGTTDTTESSPTPFPLLVGPDLTQNGQRDMFVTKVSPSGAGISYSGYIGGLGTEGNQAGIAVSPAGNAYVTGNAAVTSDQYSFPIVVGPDLGANGGTDAFVAKVNLTGSALDYAGYIGGSAADSGWGIAVDSSGAAYVAGQTASTGASFPDKIGPDLVHNGGTDAFVAKVAPSGSTLVYAGYIGGSSTDIAQSVAIDNLGNAYVAGQTASTAATFPVLNGPDLTSNGGTDAFVTKVNPAGTALSYSGYIGGSGTDIAYSVAVDSSGAANVIGDTSSTEASFPVKVGPVLTASAFTGEFTEAFVSKVNVAGSSLLYAGYLGGDGADQGRGVALDSSGIAHLAGVSGSDENLFPVIGGPDLTWNGGDTDAFVSKLSYSAPFERTADFDGNGSTDIALYRNGVWYFESAPAVTWGGDATDRAVPADYNGDGTTDIAVYRVSTGTWWVKDQFTIQYGGDPTDIPVPGDYNGDGIADLAVYRAGTWHIRNVGSFSWGGASDIAVPGDYNNDGIQDAAVYRTLTGTWYIRNLQPGLNFVIQLGGDGTDVPVPGDYTGDGATDLGVYRKATGTWYTRNLAGITVITTSWGGDGSDVPVPGDYNNNGTTDLAVYRKGTGFWYIKDQIQTAWGGDPSDKALPLPSAIRD